MLQVIKQFKTFRIRLRTSRCMSVFAFTCGFVVFALASPMAFAVTQKGSDQTSTPDQQAIAPLPISTPSASPTPETTKLANAPNGQSDECGPYSLWYQVGPDQNTWAGNYVDLCGITFDISDVVDDFDFVYFTDHRALLDKNRDGISDQYFVARDDKRIEWKPYTDCVRIDLRTCGGPGFNPNCGSYAMISIQPKPGLGNGSANIPVRVIKKCPPNGFDCSELLTIHHKYEKCILGTIPDFILQTNVEPVIASPPNYYNQVVTFSYKLIIQNTGHEKRDTILTETITQGSKGGKLLLSKIDIGCPAYARCPIVNMTNEQFQIALVGLLPDNRAEITYTRTGNAGEISRDEVSYFMSTLTLLNARTSSQIIVGINGVGEFPPPRRPEHPKPPDSTHP
jgi:hypothetical protein